MENNCLSANLNLPVSGLYSGNRPILSFKTNSPDGYLSLPKLNFLATTNQAEVTILHSYNGLMLCSRGFDFIVCNLTTQKFKVIPSFHQPFYSLLDEKFISFDPTKSRHYKVVFLQIRCLDPGELFETDGSFTINFYRADIYSSMSRTWKRVSFDHQGSYPLTEKVFCEGSIYWIDDESKLLKFNIDDEKWKVVKLIRSQPLIFGGGDRLVLFGEFGGRLFLVQVLSSTEFGLRVLEMDMHTFHWTIKFTIDLGPAINTLPAELNIKDLWGIRVLCLKEGDDQVNPMLVFAIKGKIISYNPYGDRVEFLEGSLGDYHGRGHKFIESLATI